MDRVFLVLVIIILAVFGYFMDRDNAKLAEQNQMLQNQNSANELVIRGMLMNK